MIQDPFRQIDQYCERTQPEFWAEPINALSNGFFLIAAVLGFIWCFRIPKTHPLHRNTGIVLSSLVFVIGVGSFLFHTFANVWSLFADVIPITVFMLVFFGYFVKVYFQLRTHYLLLLIAGFLLAGAGLELFLPKDFLNGSGGYLHAWLALIILGHLIRNSHKKSAKLFIASIALFTVSLGFRSVDHWICDFFPQGTHFLWHILNSCLLGILLKIPSTYLIDSTQLSPQIKK